MGEYFRNSDDAYSDPDVISTNYQVKRNAFFEVNRNLAIYNENQTSGGGGNQGSPTLIAATGGGGGYGGGGGGEGGCPHVDQYVWVERGTRVVPIKAKSLLKKVGKVRLYNPITRHFNLLIGAELLEEQPLFYIHTINGAEGFFSKSHKIIRNTADKMGVSLSHYIVGGEVLRFESHTRNIFIDTLLECSDADTGDVVKISLDKEFIYAAGMDKHLATVAHNRKREE